MSNNVIMMVIIGVTIAVLLIYKFILEIRETKVDVTVRETQENLLNMIYKTAALIEATNDEDKIYNANYIVGVFERSILENQQQTTYVAELLQLLYGLINILSSD